MAREGRSGLGSFQTEDAETEGTSSRSHGDRDDTRDESRKASLQASAERQAKRRTERQESESPENLRPLLETQALRDEPEGTSPVRGPERPRRLSLSRRAELRFGPVFAVVLDAVVLDRLSRLAHRSVGRFRSHRLGFSSSPWFRGVFGGADFWLDWLLVLRPPETRYPRCPSC